MPSKYLREEDRQHRYTSRSYIYNITRITEPMDSVPRVYKSIRAMSEELKLSDPALRKFAKSSADSTYVKSRQTGILYLIQKPERKIAAKARLAEVGVDAPEIQTFTSLYQIVKRFKVSSKKVYEMKHSVNSGTETETTITDEFGHRYYLTFYGD